MIPQKRKKSKRREGTFCTELVKQLRKKGWAFKIPDSPFQKPEPGKNRFSPPKKFDIVCTSSRISGRMTAIESKMWKLVRDPSFEDVVKLLRPATEKDPGQYVHLLEVLAAGGRSFVAIKKFIPRNSKFYLAFVESQRVIQVESIERLSDYLV